MEGRATCIGYNRYDEGMCKSFRGRDEAGDELLASIEIHESWTLAMSL